MQVVGNVQNKCYHGCKNGANASCLSETNISPDGCIYEPFYGSTLATLSARVTLHVCGHWVEVSILNRSVICVVWQTEADITTPPLTLLKCFYF